LLHEATKESALAFLVGANCNLFTISTPVVTHIRTVLPDFLRPGFCIPYIMGMSCCKCNNESMKSILDGGKLLAYLLNHAALQDILKQQENCQETNCIVSALIKAGRYRYAQEEKVVENIGVLEAVSDSTDCLYLHLRNHYMHA
jgi:hypothetical protein